MAAILSGNFSRFHDLKAKASADIKPEALFTIKLSEYVCFTEGQSTRANLHQSLSYTTQSYTNKSLIC